jgi:hypothetical protein
MSQPGNPVPTPEDRKRAAAQVPRDAVHIRVASVVFIVALIVAAAATATNVTAVAIIAGVVALAAIIYMTVWIRRRSTEAEDRTPEDRPDR